MHLVIRNAWSPLLCVLAGLVGLEAARATEGPVLSAPSTRLIDVLPQSVLDDLEVPKTRAPIRVATRPTLDWRPGLSAASEKLLTPDATEKKSVANEAAPAVAPTPTKSEPKPPALRRVEEPPTLVAPRSDASTPKGPQLAPATKAPAATAKLPVRQRKATTPDDKPAPAVPPKKPAATPEKTVEAKPAAKQASPPAVAKTPSASDANAARLKPTPKQASEPSEKQPPAKVVKRTPKAPPVPLTRGLKNLRSRLRTVLSFYYRKPLNTVENDPWELMHGMLAYELHSRVRDGGPTGPYMTAVGHLCFNRPSKRQRMMVINDDYLDVQVGVGLQGHRGQLMAMLAQCNVSPDYPIRVDDREFTIHDLIKSEQRTCYAKTELTFKLIGLGHYLDSDARWLNDKGESWDIPRLMKEEREQPIRGAACGGTHRLAGLSLAYRRREARGEPLDGEYAEAARFVSQYQSYAFRLQNEDGSLSTEWFRGRGEEEDIDRRLRTTGHLLEWLVYSLPDDQLRSYRTVRAVNYLTDLLAGNADHEWHLGSIGHALHALVLYDKRVFRPHDNQTPQVASAVDPTGRNFRGYPIYRGVMRNSPPEPTGFFGLFGGQRTGSAAGRRR